MNAKVTYHVVTAADGTIFAVFGSALRAEAVAKAANMSRPGATFYADTVTRTKRPIIGTRL